MGVVDLAGLATGVGVFARSGVASLGNTGVGTFGVAGVRAVGVECFEGAGVDVLAEAGEATLERAAEASLEATGLSGCEPIFSERTLGAGGEKTGGTTNGDDFAASTAGDIALTEGDR